MIITTCISCIFFIFIRISLSSKFLEILFNSAQPLAKGAAVSSVDSKAVASNVHMLEDTELPNKYMRTTILPEEIAYIEVFTVFTI